ncbi:CoB--CoM heterodisulfide reductase iron-sulfur subunit B family protein [Candidatus Bipolaricaulota bacterium]|nr:CoB--CoM heterodisulfide reductase iron-sulfur subunit B family protein [Candidatus Bipolaricaulota bacterium]
MAEYSFYPGCTAHSTGLEYSLSLHAVAHTLGIELKEIDDWNCCGGAAARSVSNLLGLALPARNIAKAQERDLPLAIPCPGCFNATKRAQNALSNDPQMRARLEEIVEFQYEPGLDVKSMHEIFLEPDMLSRLSDSLRKPLNGLKVASYYGCALVRHPDIVQMGDHENPVFLDELASALGAEAVDWSYKTDCCGADLAMTHGKIAAEIADNIVAGAIEAGADCLIASCGLCQVNLDMRQTGKRQKKLPTFYFTELMGVALDLPKRNQWWSMHIVNPKPTLKLLRRGGRT